MSFHTAWVISRKAQVEHFSSAFSRESGLSMPPRRPERRLVELSATAPWGRASARTLFDHLIRAQQNRWGYGKAER